MNLVQEGRADACSRIATKVISMRTESTTVPTIPLRFRNTLRCVAPFYPTSDQAIQDETPLLAASPSFARNYGGPITRAFLDSLALEQAEGVLIDSSLVWLSPGLVHGVELGPSGPAIGPRSPPHFIHEPFPGVSTGIRGASNRNLSVIHRLCVLGLDCTPEVVLGDFAFSDLSTAEAFWLPCEDFASRDLEIERRLSAHLLTRQYVPLCTIMEFGWGTLMRARPAQATGFQLVLRASVGDQRPPINGLRNLVQL